MEIVFIDGNSGSVIRKVPFEEVPPQNREVLQADGRMIPVARVVKTAFDAKGELSTDEKASFVLISEYDAEENLLRETKMLKTNG